MKFQGQNKDNFFSIDGHFNCNHEPIQVSLKIVFFRRRVWGVWNDISPARPLLLTITYTFPQIFLFSSTLPDAQPNNVTSRQSQQTKIADINVIVTIFL